MDNFLGFLVLGVWIFLGLTRLAEAVDNLARTFREVKVNVSDIHLRHVRDEELYGKDN
jgi:uncharacterized protein YoxC